MAHKAASCEQEVSRDVTEQGVMDIIAEGSASVQVIMVRFVNIFSALSLTLFAEPLQR